MVLLVKVVSNMNLIGFFFPNPGEDANCQRQQQIVGAWASRSPSRSQGSHKGVREKENRHQRG